MTNGNYEKIILKLSESSGISREELERKVEAKRAKLAGLISKEGAAQVIAAELGISFDNQELKLEELLSGMRKVNTTVKILNLYPVRKYTNKSGQESKVVNMFVADETSNTKVVLWDTNHIELIENGTIKQGSVVDIRNASVRDEEIHLGSFSEFKLSNKIIENVQTERIVKEKPIKELKSGDNIKTRAFIVQSFAPKFFYVCPECKKKAVQDSTGYVCQEHGSVSPEKRALMNLVLDDGEETIRSVLFHDTLEEIGITNIDDENMILQQRENLLGDEKFFIGNIRMNNYFNEPELIINNVENLDIDDLINNLENN
ncbi:MAG: hypothetical protein ACOC3Z_02440 [Nanoarchaeota archaeon]